MKLRAVFRFIRETNNSLLIILPGLLFSLGLAQFAMILFVFFQSPKANLLLLAIVVLNLLIFSLFIVFIIHIIMQFRFPNKFVLYKRFDDETDEILGMQVPKMILQPIVSVYIDIVRQRKRMGV